MTNGNRRFRRLAATGVLALGSMALLSGTPANAARSVADACPAGAAAEDGFTDTGDEGSALESAVDCLVAYGVSSGQTATTYGSTNPVNRGQMATFLMQKLDLVNGFERPEDAPNAFTDDEGNTHEANINDAAEIDLVAGLTGDANGDGQTPDYGPSQTVTRGQMATFIVNQLTIAGVDLPDDAADAFEDDDGNTHEANINILAALDIVDGLADGTYGPNDPVSRGQMGFFLTRDLDLLVEEGLVEPISGGQAFTGTGGGFGFMQEDDPQASVVSYTYNVLDAESVDIALLPCDNVTVNGTATFADEENDGVGNNRADGLAGTTARIETINGVSRGAVADGDDFAGPVQPNEDGEITFTINTETATTNCVTPVVWEDDDNDNALDLDANNVPVERFGVGPETTFVPPEFAGGAFGPNMVVVTQKDANVFVALFGLDPRVFFYDDNDVFQVDGVPVTLANFEANLSRGDEVSGTYATEAELVSTFNIVTNTPLAPVVDAVQNGQDIEVQVTPQAPNVLNNPLVDLFGDDGRIRIFRAEGETEPTDPTADECDEVLDPTDLDQGDYQLVAEVARADDEDEGTDQTLEFTDEDLAPGCYLYAATVVVDGDEGPLGEDDQAFEVVSLEGVAPLLINTTLDDGGAELANIDDGDTISLQFNETMNVSTENGIIRFTDAEGATFQITCGTNATCDLIDGDIDGDGTVGEVGEELSLLSVELTADPAHLAGVNTTTGSQAPGTITVLSSHFDDEAGNQVDLENSTDKVIDVEL